jgi:very-short-patch-repair endonuclease
VGRLVQPPSPVRVLRRPHTGRGRTGSLRSPPDPSTRWSLKLESLRTRPGGSAHLIRWWRAREGLPEALFDDRAVGHELHRRLAASLDSEAEKVVFEAYAGRYKASYDIPALIPQVYLHYDPYDQRTRRGLTSGTPLARQRMDFLLLFSDRQRVVIEVDGKQHYAQGDQASPALYSEMVAEDRRLRLAGYEVYRFGGYELTQKQNSAAMVQDFFAQLAERMK